MILWLDAVFSFFPARLAVGLTYACSMKVMSAVHCGDMYLMMLLMLGYVMDRPATS